MARIPGAGRNPLRRSLRARLVASFLLVSAITVVVVGAVVYVRATDDLTASVYDRLDAVVGIKADALDRWIDEQTRNVVLHQPHARRRRRCARPAGPRHPAGYRHRCRRTTARAPRDDGRADGGCRGDLPRRPRRYRQALDVPGPRGRVGRDRGLLHDGLRPNDRPEHLSLATHGPTHDHRRDPAVRRGREGPAGRGHRREPQPRATRPDRR